MATERPIDQMSDKVVARKIRQCEKWIKYLDEGVGSVPSRYRSKQVVVERMNTLKNELLERHLMDKPGPKF